jgi:hypothetical protein
MFQRTQLLSVSVKVPALIESRAIVVNSVPELRRLPQHLLWISEHLTISTAKDTRGPRSRWTESFPEGMINVELFSSVPETLSGVGTIHGLNEKLQRAVECVQ